MGSIPDEINETLAYDIGRAYAAFMKPKRVAVMSPQTRHAHSHRRLRGRFRVPKLDAVDAERALALYRAQRRRAAAPLRKASVSPSENRTPEAPSPAAA